MSLGESEQRGGRLEGSCDRIGAIGVKRVWATSILKKVWRVAVAAVRMRRVVFERECVAVLKLSTLWS
jgi:hypothetical protein